MAKLCTLYVPEDLIIKANDPGGRYPDSKYRLQSLEEQLEAITEMGACVLVLPNDSDEHGNPMYRLEVCEVGGVDSKFEIKGV